MAQLPSSYPPSSAQNKVVCPADTVTQADDSSEARQTDTATGTTTEVGCTYYLNVDATALRTGPHELTTEGSRPELNPWAPEFAPGTPWRTTSTHQHSSLHAHATGFTPGTQSHICKAGPSNMNPMAPMFVPGSDSSNTGHSHLRSPPPGLALENGTAMRVVLSACRAAGWTPNAFVAPFVPGAQQWAPYTYSDTNPEVRYRSRLNRVRCLNDDLGVPENHPPSARVVSTKVWCPRTKQYEGYYQEAFDTVEEYLHHFDFFGRVVYTKSATSPATTLAVLKASAKWLYMGTEYKSRNHFLVTSASRYLDPVVYYGQPGILEGLHGTALENACVGQCAKFYSRHGRWRYAYYGADEDRPLLDTMDPEDYEEGEIVVNGCTPGFATRVQVLAAGTQEQVAIDAARRAAWQSRKARGPVKSRLANCSTSGKSPVVCLRRYSTGRTSNGKERAMQGHSAVEQNPPSETIPAQSSGLAVATPAPNGISAEEFNRRCEAIMPSLSDWSEEEDDTDSDATGIDASPSVLAAPSMSSSGSEVGVASSRADWNRRLEAAAPLRHLSSWSDDVDNDEVEADATETVESPSAIVASTVPVTGAAVGVTSSWEEWARRLEAAAPLRRLSSWADDVEDVEEEEDSSSAQVQGCLTLSEALHQQLEEATPFRPLSSWADDVEEEEFEQEDDESSSTESQGCLTQSEALHRRLEATGSLSTNASWADDIDDDEKEKEIIVPRPSFTPSAPLATIAEETCEELESLNADEDAIVGADDVPSLSDPSTSDAGTSRSASISLDSDGTPPTSSGESNEDQVDGGVLHDDDTDNIYGNDGEACTHEGNSSAEVAVRSDDEIFGMSLEQEYENIHGVPMPVETSQGAKGEVIDTEEDIVGNVIHPNDTLREGITDNIAPGAAVNEILSDINPEESAPVDMPAAAPSASRMPAVGGSQLQAPRQQVLRRRTRFEEPSRMDSLASMPAPSPPSLAEFEQYTTDAQLFNAVSSYDQWPDFSAIHYNSSPSSGSGRSFNHDDGMLEPISASSTLRAIHTGRRRAGWNVVRLFSSTNTTASMTGAGVTSSETSEARQKGWFKKGITKVKGFFSKKN